MTFKMNPITGELDLVGDASNTLYTPNGPTDFTVGGIPIGTDLGTSPLPIADILNRELYQLAPTITLSTTPSGGLRETGDTLSSVVLNATTVKYANNITSVTFFKNASLIHTQASPLAGGGLESYTDGTGVTAATDYTAKVSDGVFPTVTSNTVSFTFAFAYYYGVGAQGLTPAQVALLTKDVRVNSPSVSFTSSPVSQVYYFAYPASYPALASILDANGFETISDYLVSTGNITNTFGQTANYRIYEFKFPTTQSGFVNTYIQ